MWYRKFVKISSLTIVLYFLDVIKIRYPSVKLISIPTIKKRTTYTKNFRTHVNTYDIYLIDIDK